MRKIGFAITLILLLPITAILATLGIRFARISNPGRIGHVAAEVDCFLKEQALELIPKERPILLLERRRAANAAFLDLIRTNMTVWDKRWQKLLFTPLTRLPTMVLPLGRPVVAINESARYAEVLALWGDRDPVLTIPTELAAQGAARLQEMGVPTGAWFVCAHAREDGYSPRDESTHAHRNSSITTYRGAIEAIVAQGGWVVRVGDRTMTPLEPMPNVIDYAVSPYKADWMDIWLCANNRFFLGSNSGLSKLATVFNKPCALVNMVPFGDSYGCRHNDISIPKIVCRKDGSAYPFAEVFAQGLSTLRFNDDYEAAGLVLKTNQEYEITALVAEMMARLDGRFETTAEDDDLQMRFRALLTPRDYGFGTTSRLGRDWLRANETLL
ncbi:MAG: TIGR04372 family glycosyltransferase [Pseudomonadota bacterium]